MPAGCVIGVDLGGTKLLAGAVDERLEVHHRAQRSSRSRDERELMDRIVSAVAEVREAVALPVEAVGFGIPSLVDLRRGTALSTVHLPLRDVAFRDVMSERLGIPVWVDNDANVALLAEHRAGAARDASHAVLLTIGTGIGGAVLTDGRLVHGARGGAGELGHMVVDLDGPLCPCGTRGCLEALASGSALEREGLEAARRWPESGLGRAAAAGRPVTGMLVTECAHDGDVAALEVLTRLGTHLGVGVANLVNALNPEVVVIGGGVIAAGDLLLDPVRAVVRRQALIPSRDDVRIVPTRFGRESGMLGAALLALGGLGGRAVAA